MQTITLNVDDEFKAAGDMIGTLIADLKAKKTVAQISTDVLPGLVLAMSGYANFAADIKKADNQVYLLRAIATALES